MKPVLRVFIASPGDLVGERAVAQNIVAELNSGAARELGWVVELIRWEDMLPEMGRPEQVILDQAEIEETDTFIGILWNRFGTPTGKADSGTEEEFEVAYRSWQKHGRPRIHFYFCQEPANLQTADALKQKGAVVEFRNRIKDLGLIHEYRTHPEFEVSIRQALLVDLIRLAQSQSHPEVAPQSTSRSTTALAVTTGMVMVPAGAFLSGIGAEKKSIGYDFLIDICPVTNFEYVEFLEQTGYLHHQSDFESRRRLKKHYSEKELYPNHPVTAVTWYDASTYAAWKGKRLPTSDEWEKAARGTDGRSYPWGSEFSPDKCNSLESGIGAPTSVQRFSAGKSPYGCYDMAGNIFEWVLDWAESPRFSIVPNSEKMNRGGSYNRSAIQVTCWYSESDAPDQRMADVGFRCVQMPL
jgi:formylglycine-generating enzyme required for sulfatase activity